MKYDGDGRETARFFSDKGCRRAPLFTAPADAARHKRCLWSVSRVRWARDGRFYRSRLLHGGLTTLFAALFARWLPPAVLAASASLSAPVPRADPHAVLPALCLLCMCSILAFPEWRRNVHFYK